MTQQRTTEMYYWITGQSAAGQLVRYGPYESELDAQRKVAEWDVRQARIWPLRTKDPNQAAQLIRAQQMTSGGISLDNVLARMRRKPPTPQQPPAGNLTHNIETDNIRTSRQVEFDDDDY